jgi:phage baseplate assembly protein W
MAKPAVESAIKLPVTIDDMGNFAMTTDQNQIWSERVRSAVGTIRGERVMQPNYGTRIANSFFDGQNVVDQTIKREISEVFNTFLNLLTLDEVEVITSNSTGSNGTITANITYTLPNLTQVTTTVGIVTINGNYPPYEETE